MHKAWSWLKKIPGALLFYRLIRFFSCLVKSQSYPFIIVYPPGHFYSPIPNLKHILNKSRVIFARNFIDCLGINLRKKSQLEMLEYFSPYYAELPFSDTANNSLRYHYQNEFFKYADAIILYSFLRYFKPHQVIEVGSGYSTALMLDVNNLFLENSIRFNFIEPNPTRLFSLLRSEDRKNYTVIQKPVQDVSLELFKSLKEGDFFFIDSSHIVKIGSDVAHIFFNILPILNPGVIIHFHDILWPFEYPKEWFIEGRCWNEAYFLRTFLQYNSRFEIIPNYSLEN